jgi:transcriptional regulator NrdR family protein
MKTYIDEGYCPNCDKDTQQRYVDSEHERDSSQDRRECLVCHWTYSGFTGKWSKSDEINS